MELLQGIIEFVYVKLCLEKYLAYSKPYLYAFKLWCKKRLLRVPWTAKR